MTSYARNQTQDSTTPEMVRRRRAASRRLPPTCRGWRDPLDGLARGRVRPPRPRRPLPPFLYVDRDGNVRDQSGAVLRSRLDVLLDAYPERPSPGPVHQRGRSRGSRRRPAAQSAAIPAQRGASQPERRVS